MIRMLYVWACGVALACLCFNIQASRFSAAGATQDAADAEVRPLQLSSQFFGMHTLSPSRHWPTVSFGAMRPAGETWGALEPAKDKYDWTPLDFWLQQTEAHGVQFDYVFLNVPAWASTRPDESCAGKRIGCAAPPHLEDWDNFVRALATRYKGRIASYEMWNEPNASGYWTGTPGQMVELAAHAYAIIKSIDPAAIVTTPAASSTGYPLSHDAWMDQYLAAGGGKYADVVAWHGYSGRNDRPALPPEELVDQIHALRAVLQKYGLERMPIWNTEGGWGKNDQLPDPKAQASFLMRWYLLQFTSGVARAYWYQWDNPNWGTLWREGEGIDSAGRAYQQVHDWLDGTTAAAPCQASAKVWTCVLVKGGTRYEAAWSTEGETTLPDSDQVESYTGTQGETVSPTGKPVVVGNYPVLLKMKPSLGTNPGGHDRGSGK
jgi:hypothetical protein